MKKIIPFNKNIEFKTNISEVTSISLEHHLSINNNDVKGELIISGDYKISDNSKTVEKFLYNLPFTASIDENYDINNAVVDIDDFYYEIIDDNILKVSIDICIDKIKEVLIKDNIINIEEKKDIIEELYEEQTNKENNQNEVDVINRCIEEDDILPEKIEMNLDKVNEQKIIETENVESINKINSIFNNVGNNEIYVSYNIYIVRDGDTVESIIEKYQTTLEELKKYNNLTDIKLGDKIVIPAK